MSLTSKPELRRIRRMFTQAEVAFNAWVENEMFHLMHKHPSMGTLLKCMGELTAYDSKGEPFEPKFLRPLQDALDELDANYACRTGNPLKITRGTPDRTTLHHTRNW